MSQHQRFRFKDKEALLNKASELGADLGFSDDISILFDRIQVAGKVLPNRFVVQPMEGFDSDAVGAPGKLAFRRYRRYAAGGSGLIWFEATAVIAEGRSNSRQLMISERTVDTFKRLVEETRKAGQETFGNNHDLLLILQLAHSGRYSKPVGKPLPVIAHHSEGVDSMLGLPKDYPLITDEELDNLQETYVVAAALAARAGFDGVDIKACHRYLVSELLASFTREHSKYGSSFENRARFLLETARRIRNELPRLLVTTRLNAYDAIPYPYGFGVDKNDYTIEDLTEPKMLIQELVAIGCPILNVSVGNPYHYPHFGRPFDFPTAGGELPAEHPLVGIARLLRITGELQQEFPQLPVVGTGYSWLRHFFPNVGAAMVKTGKATLIGQGRGAFAYPDAVKDLLEKGELDSHKVCVTCSCCTQIMRDGGSSGCVVRDNEVYGPEYRKSRRRAPNVLKQEAERCRECDSPMCQTTCPAGLDIPGFIKAYAEGNVEKAYSILLTNNLFPEMCSLICPVEVQCQGACLENKINSRPVSIADIQYAIAREARELRIAGVKVPEKPSGKKIAVIGAGPAGIACAARLLQLGHSVEILEKDSSLGGVPSRIIPLERIDSETVVTEIKDLLAEAERKGRLTIHLNSPLSKSNSLASIRARHDAVFLGFGLSASVGLPGASCCPAGVEDALSFLRRMKSRSNVTVGTKVAVLGGGNTAMDAAVVAKEHGAQDVYVVYRRSFEEMPAWKSRCDEALEKGVHFLVLSQPIDYVEEGGELIGLRIARTVLGEPDESGRRRPQILRGSEYILPVDHVIEAIGQKIDDETRNAIGNIVMNGDDLIKVDDSFRTSIADVFAGGDITNGGGTAVRAVVEGMRAALSIDESVRTQS